MIEQIIELVHQAINDGARKAALLADLRSYVVPLLSVRGANPQVFLSYSYENQSIVRNLAAAFPRYGIDVWFDQDRITFGDSLLEKFHQGIESSDAVVFFLSSGLTGSTWAYRELDIAFSRRLSNLRGPLLIPVLLEDVEIPASLRDVRYVDLRHGDVERGARDIADAVRARLGDVPL